MHKSDILRSSIKYSVLLLALATVGLALLFIVGCDRKPLIINPPAIVSDGNGGAIVVYENAQGDHKRELYARRINDAGDAVWETEDVPIAEGWKQASSSPPKIVDDNNGGAIIYWNAYPSDQDWGPSISEPLVHFISRISSDGNVIYIKRLTAEELGPYKSIKSWDMVSDGSGGIIAGYCMYSEQEQGMVSYVTSIDPEGSFPWGKIGIEIPFPAQIDEIRIISGGNGDAIIATDEYPGTVFIEKVSPHGNIMWQNATILENAADCNYGMVSDCAGGVWIAWTVFAEDIYIQHLDADGNKLLGESGKPIVDGVRSKMVPNHPYLTSDNSGGVIIIWQESLLSNIYAQHIDVEGNAKWTNGGVHLAYIETNQSLTYKSVSDDSGGAIIAIINNNTSSSKKFHLMQIDNTGDTVWNDVQTPTRKKGDINFNFDVSQDNGGILIVWGSGESQYRPQYSYAQKIDTTGKCLWGEQGIKLTPYN